MTTKQTDLERAAREFTESLNHPGQSYQVAQDGFEAGARWLLEWAEKKSFLAQESHLGDGCCTVAAYEDRFVRLDDLRGAVEGES